MVFAVGRGLGFVLVAGLVGKGVALAGVEEQFRRLGAERPERAGSLEPGSAVGALESARAARG